MRWITLIIVLGSILCGCRGSCCGKASDLSLKDARLLLQPGMTTGEFQRQLKTTPKFVAPNVLQWQLDDGQLLTNTARNDKNILVITGEAARNPGALPPMPIKR